MERVRELCGLEQTETKDYKKKETAQLLQHIMGKLLQRHMNAMNIISSETAIISSKGE